MTVEQKLYIPPKVADEWRKRGLDHTVSADDLPALIGQRQVELGEAYGVEVSQITALSIILAEEARMTSKDRSEFITHAYGIIFPTDLV
ncbi:MAG: hypothetical protein AAB512_04985 [Patescibacteria group bacterium]